MNFVLFETTQMRTYEFPSVTINNMAAVRTCETGGSQELNHNVEILPVLS